MGTRVVHFDDMTKAEDETVKPREFGIDGATYEIDLSDETYQRLRAELGQFIAVARKSASGRRPVKVASNGHATARMDREQGRAIRAWARENGYAGISDRGRIPEGVLGAYDDNRNVETLRSLPGYGPAPE